MNKFDELIKNIPQEIIDKVNKQISWIDEHPDYNKRYGTDKSYWLEEIKSKGFNPLGITIMTCEETIILETQEELEKAWEIFKPEGWWYTIDQWEETRQQYVKDIYDGKEKDAPIVYCLNDKFKHIIKNH